MVSREDMRLRHTKTYLTWRVRGDGRNLMDECWGMLQSAILIGYNHNIEPTTLLLCEVGFGPLYGRIERLLDGYVADLFAPENT
jgi:hypothetical protein